MGPIPELQRLKNKAKKQNTFLRNPEPRCGLQLCGRLWGACQAIWPRLTLPTLSWGADQSHYVLIYRYIVSFMCACVAHSRVHRGWWQPWHSESPPRLVAPAIPRVHRGWWHVQFQIRESTAVGGNSRVHRGWWHQRTPSSPLSA